MRWMYEGEEKCGCVVKETLVHALFECSRYERFRRDFFCRKDAEDYSEIEKPEVKLATWKESMTLPVELDFSAD